MKKGYLTPPVMIILALITFGVAITLYLNAGLLKGVKNESTPSPQPTSQPQPSPTPDQTANWKTYTNNSLNFSIDYPTGWTVSTEEAIKEPANLAKQFKGYGMSLNEGNLLCHLSINWGKYYSEDFSKEYNFDQWILVRKNQLINNSSNSGLKQEKIILDKKSAVKFSYTNTIFLGSGFFWEIYLQSKDLTIYIGESQLLEQSSEDKSKCESAYQQILSTFRFLD